ncbi:hypothetical protein LTR56_012220 [Elasticomyces elasticus]|nr:hypothetical protein LTR56_012220 [Elasticomyces elasticus]KAK3653021.1 hypothetical protein LTR22_011409 [Elasticomyces elasticus]KAK4919581.1 hypothetical protein LTR49_012801 [Elasticomyces elasticus]KAK5763121.1 hypothetical protein LTS12_006710 [Elasticomyces elasticus]
MTIRQYRSVRQLPYSILSNCEDGFSEQLYAQAILLLSVSLTSGTGTTRDAYIPPPHYFSFLATLAVHPLLTTRTTDTAKQAVADDALRYLRHLIKLVGPKNAELDQAFRFTEAKRHAGSRNKRIKSRNSAGPDDGLQVDPDVIKSTYATSESLWSNADDFWNIVGWAFNCSVAYPHRWRRWKVWLEMMLDVLEIDLERHAKNVTVPQSMFAQYLAPFSDAGRNSKRNLMRALLADGKQKSLNEFGEIWQNETKAPKKAKDEDVVRKRKRNDLDLENGDFGDYGDESSDEDCNTAASGRRSRSATAKPSRAASPNEDSDSPMRDVESIGIDTFGGPSSLHIRGRLVALLVRLCSLDPAGAIFLDVEELFDLLTEFIRPLPLAVFEYFACPPQHYLDANAQSSLVQMLLRPLFQGSGAPNYDENTLTQDVFETCFAPFPAGTTSPSDNAKVSVAIESLLRLLWRNGGLVARQSLGDAVRQGIKARKDKVAWDGRRRVGVKALEEETAVEVLECSVERMESILELVSRSGAS